LALHTTVINTLMNPDVDIVTINVKQHVVGTRNNWLLLLLGEDRSLL
jgi:hypothetical protein